MQWLLMRVTSISGVADVLSEELENNDLDGSDDSNYAAEGILKVKRTPITLDSTGSCVLPTRGYSPLPGNSPSRGGSWEAQHHPDTVVDVPPERGRENDLQKYLQNIRDSAGAIPSLDGESLGPFQLAVETPSSNIQIERISDSTETSSDKNCSSDSDAVSAHSAAENKPEEKWKPTRDEQIVNVALINYLTALALNIPGSRCGWSIGRLAFKVSFKDTSMEARTDGYIGISGVKNDHEAFAILETKAGIRSRTEYIQTTFQQSCEMVIWIRKDLAEGRKVPLRRRFLISQDRHEIYVTKATYDDGFLAYLNGTDDNYAGFMKMEEYGPFMLNDAGHMNLLSKFVVDLCLEISDEISKAIPLPTPVHD